MKALYFLSLVFVITEQAYSAKRSINSIGEYECGKKGTISERIADCDGKNFYDFKPDGTASVVAQVYVDHKVQAFIHHDNANHLKLNTKYSLVWSPPSSESMNKKEAKLYCDKMNFFKKNWGLPSRKDFLTLANIKNKDSKRNPNLPYIFTELDYSSLHTSDTEEGETVYVSQIGSLQKSEGMKHKVRCIAVF